MSDSKLSFGFSSSGRLLECREMQQSLTVTFQYFIKYSSLLQRLHTWQKDDKKYEVILFVSSACDFHLYFHVYTTVFSTDMSKSQLVIFCIIFMC